MVFLSLNYKIEKNLRQSENCVKYLLIKKEKMEVDKKTTPKQSIVNIINHRLNQMFNLFF